MRPIGYTRLSSEKKNSGDNTSSTKWNIKNRKTEEGPARSTVENHGLKAEIRPASDVRKTLEELQKDIESVLADMSDSRNKTNHGLARQFSKLNELIEGAGDLLSSSSDNQLADVLQYIKAANNMSTSGWTGILATARLVQEIHVLRSPEEERHGIKVATFPPARFETVLVDKSGFIVLPEWPEEKSSHSPAPERVEQRVSKLKKEKIPSDTKRKGVRKIFGLKSAPESITPRSRSVNQEQLRMEELADARREMGARQAERPWLLPAIEGALSNIQTAKESDDRSAVLWEIKKQLKSCGECITLRSDKNFMKYHSKFNKIIMKDRENTGAAIKILNSIEAMLINVKLQCERDVEKEKKTILFS
jgi:hypothetical protein